MLTSPYKNLYISKTHIKIHIFPVFYMCKICSFELNCRLDVIFSLKTVKKNEIENFAVISLL